MKSDAAVIQVQIEDQETRLLVFGGGSWPLARAIYLIDLCCPILSVTHSILPMEKNAEQVTVATQPTISSQDSMRISKTQDLPTDWRHRREFFFFSVREKWPYS